MKGFWSPIPLPVGDWTITTCIRWTGGAIYTSAAWNYASAGIVLGDDTTPYTFLLAAELAEQFYTVASCSGYTSYNRNYFSVLNSNEMWQLAPSLNLYFLRVTKVGTVYTTQWSLNGITWTTTTNGGTGILQPTSDLSLALIPTRWGIGTQYIPYPGSWDILFAEVTSAT
jgi:hypothetical protein